MAEQLESGPELSDFFSRIGFNFPYFTGFWVGKGFVGAASGECESWAYNLFMESDKLVRK